jgi:adenylate cyclase
VEEAARHAGLEADLVVRLRTALGLPPPEPGVPEYTRRDVEGMRLIGALRRVISDDSIFELASVLGHSMSQYSAAQVELFRREFAAPIAATGDELEAALSFASVFELVTAPSNLFLASVHRAHLDQAVRAESLELIEAAAGGLPDTVELAVGFADLVGFTAASERLTPLEVGEMAAQLQRAAERVFPQHQGRIVKSIGDGVMYTTPDLATGVAATRALLEASQDLPPMRAGLGYGPVLRRAGDCFGRTVNMASRLCAVARPGTALVWTNDGPPDIPGRRRRVSLRGVRASVSVVEIAPALGGRKSDRTAS